ncbi:STB5 [Fusarium beomiforme]|uniref:STB5 n=1 Tax=Fusarium beomiforme TaxID=44412 RepID=A0A9P5A6E2_9HYPO|nr:STB5 [Fusarium beomiforme]
MSAAPEQRLFACQRCSRRKQRCDRAIPVCQPCQEAQAECIGSASEETVISENNRVIIRKGPVTRLLEQIESLEERLRSQARDDNAAPAAGNHGMLSPTTTETATAPPPPDSPALPHPTSMNMRFLSLSAMAEPSSRRGEFLKHLSTPRLIAGITKTYGGDPESTSRPDSLWEGISTYLHHPRGVRHRLRIPRADANKALQIYLTVVDFRFPRLSVEKVLMGIDAISHPEEDHFQRTVARDPAHVFMAYAVITIVPLVSDKYPISQGSWVSVHLLGKCMELLDAVFRQEDGIDIIQCLQLLVILAVHCSAAGSAWHLSSFAMNKCIALGYHREDQKSNASMPSPDVQPRRWAFWGCYLLDILICAALGRPTSIDARHITTPLPDAASNTTSPCAQHGQAISDIRGSDSNNSGLGSRHAYHRQLFQYARLLSQVISEAQNNPSSSPASNEYEQLLGQALSWRISALPHDEPESCNIFLFQTSLYNTLMLRLAVKELLDSFSFESSLHDPEVPFQPFAIFLGDMAYEESRIKRLKLSQICASVARSLDRIHMTGRSYLSLITGYSSLTMAFTCLYCMAVPILARDKTSDGGSGGPSNSDSAGQSMARHPSRVSSWGTGNHLPTLDSRSSSSYNWSPAGQIWVNDIGSDGINDSFNIAIAKVDIVGRQFPRLNQYNRMALDIRKLLIPVSSPDVHFTPRFTAMDDQLEKIKVDAQDIGPMYLRHLIAAILCLISQSQRS